MNTLRQISVRLNYSSALWVRVSLAPFGTRIAKLSLPATKTYSSNFGISATSLLPVRLSGGNMATSVQVAKAHSQVKPPNVLVLLPVKDSTSQEFSRIKDALDSCLTPERYVIYPIGLDEIQQCSPWQDNCRLLLVPPSATEHAQSGCYNTGGETVPLRMNEKILQEITSYVSKGGVLLSMHAQLNSTLGLDSQKKLPSKYCQHGVCNVAPKSLECGESEKPIVDKFNALHISALLSTRLHKAKLSCDQANTISQDSSDSNQVIQLETGIISKEVVAFLSLVETDATLEWLDVNTNQCNNVASEEGALTAPQLEDSGELTTTASTEESDLVCVRKVELEQGGKLVLSNVDLFPSVPQDIGVKMLVWLKRGVEQRRRFLSSILLSLGLECSEESLPELTHTYLVCSSENRTQILSSMTPLLDSSSSIVGSDMSARLITTNFEDGSSVDGFPPPPGPSELAILTNPAKWQVRSLSFDFLEYFKLLKTRKIGRSFLYTPVIASTQTLFTGNIPFCSALTPEMGVVSVAAQQTKGKGRSGNVWISPKGSMMFSMALKFLPTDKLAQRMPLLQHLVAMAVVHGIKTIPGYEGIPLCIKWPNDIYYQNKVKLGGILVTCFSIGHTPTITAVIGCGVNINNQFPTMSVNDCITLHNSSTGGCLSPISEEQALARTLNCLEEFLTTYQRSEMEELEPLYYKYWLHSGAVVRLASQANEEVTILGIDNYGYLRVETNKSKEVLSLQPDGNTFDIMKGLIATKLDCN